MVDVVSFSVADTTAANNVSNQGVSILGTGLVSTADDTMRAIWSIVAKFYDDFGGQSTVAGTGDAITITSTTVYTALASGMRLLFKASAANTTAATLNLDAIGAKAVRKISGGTDVALTANDIPSAGARVDMVYDSTANSAAGAWILISGSGGSAFATNTQAATATSTTVALTPANLAQERGFSNDPFINLSIGTVSASAGALTIPLKGVDGNDWSASNIGYVTYRSSTVTSGAVSQLALVAASSFVISSGSTFGATNNVPFVLYLVSFNDAGTFRPGAILCTTLSSTTLTQYPLFAWGIASSTAEGGAGAADGAQTLYTGTAVTSKAYRVLAKLYYESGLAAVGTWVAPTRVELFGPGSSLPGQVLQAPEDIVTSSSTTTTAIPLDDTVPQNTEGAQFHTISITPSSAANLLEPEWQGEGSASANGAYTMGLFQDSTVGAIAADSPSCAAGNAGIGYLRYLMVANTTSSTAFKARLGCNAGATFTYLGVGGSGLNGAAKRGTLRVKEIAA